jgi:hypothetical protein
MSTAPFEHRRASGARAGAIAVLTACALASCTQPTQIVPVLELECHGGEYACTWAEVSEDVLQRTLALGHAAVEVVRGGGSIDDAAAFLSAADGVLEVMVGNGALRYRLDGGRPAWASFAVFGSAVAGQEISSRAATRASSVVAWSGVPVVRPSSVVGVDPAAKRALVLSPFEWRALPGDNGSAVASLLEDTRGYEGRVQYLANSAAAARTVTLDTFLDLDGHDVVYIATLGFAAWGPCHLTAGTDCSHTLLGAIDYLEGDPNWRDQTGIEPVTMMSGNVILGVSHDFFREHYPTGIAHGVIWIQASESAASYLATAIPAADSMYVGWSGSVDSVAARNVATSFVELVTTTGIPLDRANDALGAANEVPGGALRTLRSVQDTDVRIREVVVLRHPGSGSEHTSDDALIVTGTAGDGQPDALTLMIDIDGLSAIDLVGTSLTILVDDWSAPQIPLGGGDWAWVGDSMTRRLVTTLDTPFDFADGQRVKMGALASLADGGTSQHVVTPTVTDGRVLPRTWVGTTRLTAPLTTNGSAAIVRTATVSFTRDPSQAADSPYPRYISDGGTMTWQLGGSYGTCSDQSPLVTVPLSPSSYDYVLIDTTTSPFTYAAYGHLADGPLVTVSSDCSDTDYETRAGGTWLLAPDVASHTFTMSGNVIEGEYRGAGQLPVHATWSLIGID